MMKRENRKGPKGYENPLEPSLGSFWKIRFINPPEVRGQVAERLKLRMEDTMQNYQNLLFWSIRK
jgi:hypothetical protein